MTPSSFAETLIQDLRFGARALRRNPGFATIAILTLALGIGANAAIFSVVSAVLLRPLPWTDADRAVMIWSKWTAFDKTWVATGEVVDYRRRSQTLAEVAAWGHGQVNLTGDGEPERLPAGNVTSNLFSTLGVTPLHGRTFTAAEDVANGPRLVLLGHALWVRRFAADPSVVGRSIQINGLGTKSIGVMPADFVLPTDFQNPEPTQLWMPLQMDPASTDHGSHGLYAAGRLKPGATVEQAADDLHGIARAMTAEGLYPGPDAVRHGGAVADRRSRGNGPPCDLAALRRRRIPVADRLRERCQPPAGAGGGASARDRRARGTRRQRRTGGAATADREPRPRHRRVHHRALPRLCRRPRSSRGGTQPAFHAWPESTVDLQVLFFTTVVALVTSVAFSLAPAMRALRIDLTDSLKDGAQGASSGGARQRFRNALVVVEMALAVVLLVGAGLMLRSLWSLQRVELGFDPTHVQTMRLSLPAAAYERPEQVVLFFERLLDRVRQLPGVRTAGAVRSLPLGSTIGDCGLQIEGYTPTPGTGAKGDWQIVTDGYLEAMGERLVRGRSFTAADQTETMLGGVDQRGDGAPVLVGTGSDRRPVPDRQREPAAPVCHGCRHRGRRPAQRHHRCRQREVLRAAHAMACVDRQSRSVPCRS